MFDNKMEETNITQNSTFESEKKEILNEVKEASGEAKETPKVSIEENDLHVMPDKFLPSQPTRTVGAGLKITLISLVLVIFLGGLIGGGYWYLTQRSQPEDTNTNTNVVVNTNTNANTNINVNTNVNTNINTNVNEEPPPPVLPPVVLDVDDDGLTQEEENLFATNSTKEDTDKDGYKDGVEIVNLYDPLTPGGLLIDSGLVEEYVNETAGYSFLKPSSWIVSLEDEIGTVMADSYLGDFFIFTMLDNDGSSVEEVLDDMDYLGAGADNFEDYENYSLGGRSAIRSLNGQHVLMVTDDMILMIGYGQRSLPEVNFETTFEMFLNSFTFLNE